MPYEIQGDFSHSKDLSKRDKEHLGGFGGTPVEGWDFSFLTKKFGVKAKKDLAKGARLKRSNLLPGVFAYKK